MNLDLKKITKDDIFYYVLPEGSTLYKGLVNEDRVKNIASYEWYGMSEKVAEIYGHIYLYVVKKQVLLYAMDERSNVEQLLRDARVQSRNDVVVAIKDTFQLFPDTNEVIRHSDPDNDKIVAEFICLNRAGYAADQLRKWKDSVNYFHSEIMLNNANTIVEYANKKIETSVSSTAVSNRLAPKKGTRPHVLRTNTIQRKLFGEQQEESPYKIRRMETEMDSFFSPEKDDTEEREEREERGERGEREEREERGERGEREEREERGEREEREERGDNDYLNNTLYSADADLSYSENDLSHESYYGTIEENEDSFSSARKNLFSQFDEARVLF